jgi:hypothetical protein
MAITRHTYNQIGNVCIFKLGEMSDSSSQPRFVERASWGRITIKQSLKHHNPGSSATKTGRGGIAQGHAERAVIIMTGNIGDRRLKQCSQIREKTCKAVQ